MKTPNRFAARLKEARVELPPGTLAPGGYNFTLCVSKGGDSGTFPLLKL